MRKVYIVLISLFFSLMSFAGEVTEEQAFQKAQQFMKGKQFKQTNLRRASSTGDKAYFVFNVENNGGFVIVSGDRDYKRMVDYLIMLGRFRTILLPCKRYASSLYKSISRVHYAYLDTPDMRAKLALRKE